MAVSPDGNYLFVGTPEASGVTTNFKGIWQPTVFYQEEDIVLYGGSLWKALNSNSALPDGSSNLSINTDDWVQTSIIPATPSGRVPGLYNQGMISVYRYSGGRFDYVAAFSSPRPTENEKFGSEISVGVDGTTYYLSVSAVGSYNNTGRVYLFKGSNQTWEGISNPSYKGIYNPTKNYYVGDIVWQASQDPIVDGAPGILWQALEDQAGDGSTITIESASWAKVSNISTDISVPTNIAVDDDGSTLASGILTDNQMAELIKEGDHFGFSTAMNKDGSILVVGAPYSDGQYFANYKGIWRPDVEYVEGDVVKYRNLQEDPYIYYRLNDLYLGVDSTYRSLGDEPSSSSNWEQISDSTNEPSGKIFVYKRTEFGFYELIQMINSGSIADFSDIDNANISSGDDFGYSVDIDANGKTLVVSRPKAETNYNDQGSVYVLGFNSVTSTFRVKQKLESYEVYPGEYFGYGVSISPDGSKIAIGAKNAPTLYSVNFDMLTGTQFDGGRTAFFEDQGYTGGVYVFDKKDQIFYLTEKLDLALQDNEAFGYSVDCVGSVVLVGSPYYRDIVTDSYKGMVRLFRKDDNLNSWNLLSRQSDVIDIRKVKSIELYNNVKNVKIQDVDYVDPAKGKILNIAERELSFKTPYDPAIYTVGTEEVVVDYSVAWYEKNVGKLWWNTATAKWLYAEQGDESYRLGNWNQLSTGSTIDVYEWVETPLLPSEWAALADTNEGIAEGISGQPLYPNDDVYSIKEFYSSANGQVSETLYYYWVKNKSVTPLDMPSRSMSAISVANMISNPAGTGVAFVALIDSDKFVAYNFESVISSDTALLNIQYRKDLTELKPVHSEYQLLTEGVADSLPAKKLEDKWIDSLVGYDKVGNRVPDSNLSAKQKYGVSVRPRQSMFIDRLSALKMVVTNINTILNKEPFVDEIEFSNLNLKDEIPESVLNLYDTVVDTEIDLQTVGTVRTKQAVLSANLVNGQLDTIDIIDPGFGYRVVPPLEIEGDGTGAKAEAELDSQGRIKTVTVTSRGKKYSVINVSVRNFSVLVKADSTINNFWSIYAWDNVRKVFFRSQSQSYDTTKYWSYVDWWAEGYSKTTRVAKEFNSIYEESFDVVTLGDLIRIKEYGAGGWAVFEKIANTGNTFLDRYSLVGRQNGTIQLSSSIYDTTVYGIGFDNTQAFDDANYDIDNSRELRNIFTAVKDDIFIGTYAVEWNKLFFASMRYVLSEQQYVDWMFKTSFLNATHNVGSFEKKNNYKNDNLESYQEYINEVKPFRTTVREYVSRYDNVETYSSSVADFDLPPTYSQVDGAIVPININRPELSQYPWKWWTDNNGYSVVKIEVYDAGADYKTPPKVLIEGNGTGASAQAYISNGKVSGIVILDEGYGYTTAPTVSLVGGNPANSKQAKATAVLGNAKPRTFNLTVKFDRISKTGEYQDYNFTEQLVPDGKTSVFELKYAPTRDKSLINVYKNNQLLLSNEYSINLYYLSTDSYKLLRGKISFVTVPLVSDVIVVDYEKNIELFDAVNRINKHYSPTAGMVGKEINQLMTGIDFGGVQIQGTTFEVTGGWDALPWFTDNWDSVESSSDYYHVCTGATQQVTLPFVPTNNQEINIYIRKEGETKTTRIDDPNYTDVWDSSVAVNPNAQMPTFVGDGSTAIIEIGKYIETASGDTLIFRPTESDGSVTITDSNLLDTKLSGGTLAAMEGAYVTATGMTAEEITITGGKFIEPDHVPAPEENVPGQVLDSVSIRVFHSTVSGSAPLQSKISEADGNTSTFDIGQRVLENKSVFVYVDKLKKEVGVDYTIDLTTYKVNFNVPPAAGANVEVLSIGIGGLGIIDYQEFVADGTTNLFLTNANYDYTSSVFVTVNGEYVNAGFKNSTEVIDAVGKTLVEFGFYPSAGDVIKIVCLEASSDVDLSGVSVIKVNTQTAYFEGSTRTFDLDNFVELSRGSARNSMIVEVNGKVLKGSDTIYSIYDGVTKSFTLGTDPYESPGTILPSNIRVFINNILKTFITDYVYDGTAKVLTINESSLNVGDIIKIQNDFRAEYRISGNSLIIDPDYNIGTVTNETDNVKIDITWFSEYPSMDIVSDQKSGGKVQYKLSRLPISASYVWVYKNGQRLTQDVDYAVSLPRGVVYLNVDSTSEDDIKTISFTRDIFRLPSAFEIHKDMLNIYHYSRFSKGGVKLAKDLTYYATTIEVTDSSSLADPVASRNIPGVLYIAGERIEYMTKVGNVLGQLRRGVQGTAIGELYLAGTDVVDLGYQDSIPYRESQERVDFVSDGSTILIGPLDFIPKSGTRKSWFRDTIPDVYGPCDELEVFVAGRRLRKDPYDVWVENNGAYSPDADRTVEAEFSVDGTSAYIRLTSPVTAGTRITVIKRVGKTWYDRGDTTASSGASLLENSSPIAKFIAQKTTSLPE